MSTSPHLHQGTVRRLDVFWLPFDQATAYCSGCEQNVFDGRPGYETECVSSDQMVVLEAPRRDARNVPQGGQR